MVPQIRIGCCCAQEGPNPGAGAQILETLRGCKVERKEPEASPASMVSCSTPRFPSSTLCSPAPFFWCILWGGCSPAGRSNTALLPSQAWVRSAGRPRSLQASAPARSQGEARPTNNQESKEPPARHGEPLPGRLQPLPALAAEPPSAAPGGGSRAAPQNPVKRCPYHPSSHEQDLGGQRGQEDTSSSTRKPFFSPLPPAEQGKRWKRRWSQAGGSFGDAPI